MILSFSKENVVKRKFVEKIWASIIAHVSTGEELGHWEALLETCEYFKWDEEYLNTATPSVKPKDHTIRMDKSNRWKADNDIHFVVNNRTKNYFRFAPIIKCKSVQKIEINAKAWSVKIDHHRILPGTLHRLAINDGFDSVESFFDYFNKDFTGNIIHWTNLKY